MLRSVGAPQPPSPPARSSEADEGGAAFGPVAPVEAAPSLDVRPLLGRAGGEGQRSAQVE